MHLEWLTRAFRKTGALALTVALNALPVVVPVLDRDLAPGRPVLEAHHQPGVCVRAHDHTLCSAFGAQRWATFTRPLPQLAEQYSTLSRTGPNVSVTAPFQLTSLHPRAPPLV